jgi:hypothetical protein
MAQPPLNWVASVQNPLGGASRTQEVCRLVHEVFETCLCDSQDFLVTMAASVMFVARLTKATIHKNIHSFIKEVDGIPFDFLGQ